MVMAKAEEVGCSHICMLIYLKSCPQVLRLSRNKNYNAGLNTKKTDCSVL